MPGAPKGMRWSTAVAVVQQAVERHVANSQAEANRGTDFLNFLKRVDPPAKSTRVIGITHLVPIKGFGKNGRPQPGSIPDRVLDIVGEFDEPVTMGQILSAKHGAKHHSVILAVRALVRSGHLVATGETSKRRYSLPAMKKGKLA